MLGTRILELRTEKGLTQSDVATAIGISYISIGNYENETRIPNADVIVKLADYFDVSADYLLGRTNIKKTEISHPSNPLEFTWNAVQKDQDLNSILRNMLIIIEIIKKSDSLYDNLLYKDKIGFNEFISNSVSLFNSLTNYYLLCTNIVNLPVQEHIKDCDIEVAVISSSLNELKYLLLEINDPTYKNNNNKGDY